MTYDPKRRFTAGSVTGWPITTTTLHSARAYRKTPTTIAYVLDSAYGYRVVAEFTRRNLLKEQMPGTPLEAAQARADQLNREEATHAAQ